MELYWIICRSEISNGLLLWVVAFTPSLDDLQDGVTLGIVWFSLLPADRGGICRWIIKKGTFAFHLCKDPYYTCKESLCLQLVLCIKKHPPPHTSWWKIIFPSIRHSCCERALRGTFNREMILFPDRFLSLWMRGFILKMKCFRFEGNSWLHFNEGHCMEKKGGATETFLYLGVPI